MLPAAKNGTTSFVTPGKDRTRKVDAPDLNRGEGSAYEAATQRPAQS